MTKPRLFRCGLCIEEDGVCHPFTWQELLDHKHSKKMYWEIEEPYNPLFWRVQEEMKIRSGS